MTFQIMYTNTTTNAFRSKQNNETQIDGGSIFKHHDKHQVGINYYNTVHTSGNKSTIVDGQSHNLINDKDIIITDIIKINNNNFRDVRIFNNLGTDYHHNLNDNDPPFKVKFCHVIQPQINKNNHHNPLLHNNMNIHGNIPSHSIINNTKGAHVIVTHSDRTDPDIVPSIRLCRNTLSFTYKWGNHIQPFYSHTSYTFLSKQ